MSRPWNDHLGAAFPALVLLVALGCGGSSPSAPPSPTPPPPIPAGTVAPDFALVDANPGSPTGGRPISPRDYLNQISAWYFGTST